MRCYFACCRVHSLCTSTLIRDLTNAVFFAGSARDPNLGSMAVGRAHSTQGSYRGATATPLTAYTRKSRRGTSRGLMKSASYCPCYTIAAFAGFFICYRTHRTPIRLRFRNLKRVSSGSQDSLAISRGCHTIFLVPWGLRARPDELLQRHFHLNSRILHRKNIPRHS